VVLNGDHTIVPDLDIYDRVGNGIAYDEYIPFSVDKGRLYYNEEESDIRGGKIRVEFIKVIIFIVFIPVVCLYRYQFSVNTTLRMLTNLAHTSSKI
jgi:hypothetical protein